MLSAHVLQQRSNLLQTVRSFFVNRSYLEVDTPVRLPVLIPEAEIIPIESESWFLQTSPELCMKQLLTCGCPRLFQICHCFRRGEIGRLHQEEFSLLEWYHVGWDYVELMAECEQMIYAVAQQIIDQAESGKEIFLLREGKKISLALPWQRLSVAEAFLRFAELSAEEAIARGQFDEILVESVEPNLGWQRPVFLYDYPVSLASLARPKSEIPNLAERFELYIGGIELANGFSELTDPAEQRQRFQDELRKIKTAGRSQSMPDTFLSALADLEDCAGIALGIDRLLLLFLGARSIAEVLPFSGQEL